MITVFEANKNMLRLGRGSAQSKKKDAAKHAPSKRQDSEEVGDLDEWQAQNEDKISKLVDVVKNNNGAIVPDVNYAEGKYAYSVLGSQDGAGYGMDFVERLSSPEVGILDRFVYSRFLVCPEHQSSFLVNVRQLCPKCNSVSVERLHLLEHKSCGYLAEKSKFAQPAGEQLQCPSCNRQVKNAEKEIRVPATWYFCNDCGEKFDDATIRLYCKEFDHDFSVNDARTVTIYGYVLAESERPALDRLKLKADIEGLLSEFGFTVEEDYSVRGRSGNDHLVDIHGVNQKRQSVFVLVGGGSEDSIDSKMVQILDSAPSVAILAGFASVTEKTKFVASKYNTTIITSQSIPEILSDIKKILVQKLNLGVAAAK